ncbi:hypothetical protein, partial [Xanthomonas phaseoli]
ANDLFFGKALLHVQSPSVRELDSKLRCYSKSGGRRAYQTTMDVLAYVASTSAGAAFLIAQDDGSAAPSPLLEA